MNIKLSRVSWKRNFSVPCSLFDNYIKEANEAALKVILCIYASDDETLSVTEISKKTGLTNEQTKGAVEFWIKRGVVCDADEDSPASVPTATVRKTANHGINMSEYVQNHPEYKELVKEAEVTLGRTLNELEKKTLAVLTDFYGFTASSVILILEHSAKTADHVSAKYVETVAAGMHEKGIHTYQQLEDEFSRLDEYHSFESEIKRILDIDVKLTKKQTEYISSWRDKGFSIDMIALARERCVDAKNKVIFGYIDKIIVNWESKGIFTLEAAEGEAKPAAKDGKQRSFDLGEYDDFSLGDYIKK